MDAISEFSELGDYMESEKYVTYSQASELMKSESYSLAENMFSTLDGFLDSKERYEECETKEIVTDWASHCDDYLLIDFVESKKQLTAKEFEDIFVGDQMWVLVDQGYGDSLIGFTKNHRFVAYYEDGELVDEGFEYFVNKNNDTIMIGDSPYYFCDVGYGYYIAYIYSYSGNELAVAFLFKEYEKNK